MIVRSFLRAFPQEITQRGFRITATDMNKKWQARKSESPNHEIARYAYNRGRTIAFEQLCHDKR